MRVTRTIVLLSSLSLALAATMQFARADGAAITLHGNDRGAPACVTCHGAYGEGMAANGFPRLAGLDAGYIQTQLDAFTAMQPDPARVIKVLDEGISGTSMPPWPELAPSDKQAVSAFVRTLFKSPAGQSP